MGSVFKHNIEKAEAYWINPNGQFMAVDTSHIQKVIENPEEFELSHSEIQGIYNEELEELGIEGKARERIIIMLIQKGWIRIRQYPKRSSWTVNINEMNKHVIYILKSWANEIINAGVSCNDEVIIDSPNGRVSFSMSDILSGEFYKKFFEK